MAKAYVYYDVSYPHHKVHVYNPHCLACAIRIICQDPRPKMQLETTDFESTKCEKCGDFIPDTIEI